MLAALISSGNIVRGGAPTRGGYLRRVDPVKTDFPEHDPKKKRHGQVLQAFAALSTEPTYEAELLEAVQPAITEQFQAKADGFLTGEMVAANQLAAQQLLDLYLKFLVQRAARLEEEEAIMLLLLDD